MKIRYNRALQSDVDLSVLERVHYNANAINPEVYESDFSSEIDHMMFTTALFASKLPYKKLEVHELGIELLKIRRNYMVKVAELFRYIFEHGTTENDWDYSIEEHIPGHEKGNRIYIHSYVTHRSVSYNEVNIEIRLEESGTVNNNTHYESIMRSTMRTEPCTSDDDNMLVSQALVDYDEYMKYLIESEMDLTVNICGSVGFSKLGVPYKHNHIRSLEFIKYSNETDMSMFSDYVHVIGNAVMPSKDKNELPRIISVLTGTDKNDIEAEMFDLYLKGYTSWDIINTILYGHQYPSTDISISFSPWVMERLDIKYD